MTQAKYFQKLKCKSCTAFDDNATHQEFMQCKGTGIIKGADITETIKPIFEGIKKIGD